MKRMDFSGGRGNLLSLGEWLLKGAIPQSAVPSGTGHLQRAGPPYTALKIIKVGNHHPGLKENTHYRQQAADNAAFCLPAGGLNLLI